MSSSSSFGTRKPASRYTSFESQNSSSSEFRSQNDSSAIAKLRVKNDHNFGAMVKKFMEKRSFSRNSNSRNNGLIIPPDFIAQDLNKSSTKPSSSSNFTALPRKLFGKASNNSNSNSNDKKSKPKALTEVKSNTRTLAMVLRSERELLSLNKDQQSQIAHLKSSLDQRNLEVEKLKNLCLKQREEIKALKSAILFPDEMNSQLQEVLEKQGSELKQTKQVIPTLQRQISSLTGQLQCLSQDLAQVKAVKYTSKTCIDGNFGSPRTPIFDHEEPANSLDFSDDDPTTPDSPDDMLLKDVNPCLTPCYSKMKCKEYRVQGCDYDNEEEIHEVNWESCKVSRSSDHFRSLRPKEQHNSYLHRSDESKDRYKRRMDHQVL